MVSEEIMEYHKEPFRTEKTFPKQENAVSVPVIPTGIRKEIPAGKKLRVRSAKAGMDAFFAFGKGKCLRAKCGRLPGGSFRGVLARYRTERQRGKP